MPRLYIAFGSNIDPERNILQGLRLLAEEMTITAVSTVYASAPIGRPEQEDFYNGAIEVETDLPPLSVKLDILRVIEAAVGRVRIEDKYAARELDLDIIAADPPEPQTDELPLPDPDIYQRAFVAIPLAEIAPELALPDTGLRAADVAARFHAPDVTPLPDFTLRLRREALHGPGKSRGTHPRIAHRDRRGPGP